MNLLTEPKPTPAAADPFHHSRERIGPSGGRSAPEFALDFRSRAARRHILGMEPDTDDLLACARILDARLHETLDDPFRLRRGRLYGATFTPGDDHDPVKLCFLGDHRDVYELVAGPIGVLARQFDAAVVAITGWAAPLDEIGPGGVARPSLHPERHRIRACCAVGDAGVVAVMRTDREPDAPAEMSEAGAGAMPDALLAMWAGAPIRSRATWGDEGSRNRIGRHRRPA